MGRFSFFSEIVTGLLERTPFGAPEGTDQTLDALCHALLSGRGEISGKRVAQDILSRYKGLAPDERLTFFRLMAQGMDVDTKAVIRAAEAYGKAPTGASYAALADAAEPPRQEFLRRLNQAPGATLELVRMRLDLLGVLRDHPELAPLDLDFIHLFRSWFNRGFLVLRRIDWRTPANILEKIIAYEAVHAINDWSDLQRRLLPEDRRCFAFFHPAMLEEPLIFVEVALCKGIPGSVQSLLAETRTPLPLAQADTAVFYSISNCQEGLRGISFGNSLIKQVVEELRQELPHLDSFVTLSPIPGLMRHLATQEGEAPRAIAKAAKAGDRKRLEAMAPQIRLAAADYLVNAKRGAAPLDPVARFHLGNGALIHRVHAGADISDNGIRQSAGAMVSYLYDLARVEANHEGFATANRVVISKEIKTLLQTGAAQGKQT